MTLDYPYWHSPLILCWNWMWQQLLIKFHYAVVSDKIVTNLPPLLCITWAYSFLHFLTHACTRAHIHTDLVHLSCTSNAPTAREDLYPFVNAFLTTPEREQGWADRQIGRHKQIDRQSDWQTDRHMILLVLLLATVFSSTLIYSLFCICVHVLVYSDCLWLQQAMIQHTFWSNIHPFVQERHHDCYGACSTTKSGSKLTSSVAMAMQALSHQMSTWSQTQTWVLTTHHA